jgi:putative membrane protein
MKPDRLSRQSRLPIAAILVASLGLAACGDRQPTTTTTTAPTATPPANTAAPAPAAPAAPTTPAIAAADRDFVTMAASSSMMEVEASKMALEKSKNEEVRKFAQRMVDDHSKASEELRSMAGSAGMTEMPSAMVQVHASHMDRLRALGGQEFDREYAAQVGVAAHTEAVDLFEGASRDASNPDVRQFAEQKLPALRDHLEHAQKLAKSVGVTEERMKSARAKQERGVVGMGAATGTTGATGTTDARGTPAVGTTTDASGTTTGPSGRVGNEGSTSTMEATGMPGKGTGVGTGTSGTATGANPVDQKPEPAKQ